MNVTELLANVQPQSNAGSAKANGTGAAGVFQALLADGLDQAGMQEQAAAQLLDMISQLNGDQIAQLLAMFGLTPASAQADLSAGADSAGKLAINVQAGNMFTQDGMQLSAALLANAAQGLAATGAGKHADVLASQLVKNLSELLTQAGISAEGAVSELKDSLAKGSDLVSAFRDLTEQAKLKALPSKLSNAQTVPDTAFAVIGDSGSLRQMGSQIRPDMLNAVAETAEAKARLTANAESSNDNSANQPLPPAAEGTEIASNLTAATFTLPKSQQVSEGQPTAVQVKMSAAQFESDFSTMLVKQATLTERGGLSEMRVTLMPEGMGEIHVRIQGEGGIVSLQIAADTQHARSLLDANLGILKQHLEAQGMHVNRVEVVAANTSSGMNNMDQGMFDGRSRQQQDTNQQQSNRQPSANSKYQFEEELMYQQASNMSAGEYDWIA